MFQHPECECSHHTCGANCEICCPMFNQRKWSPGTVNDSKQCMQCNCHGHASSCHYDENVDKNGLSLDVNGNYQGGGVCDNCTVSIFLNTHTLLYLMYKYIYFYVGNF